MNRLLFAAAVGWAAATLSLRPLLRRERPAAVNHRGERVPAVLGMAIFVGVAAVGAVVALTDLLADLRDDPPGDPARAGALLGGAALVFAAGLYDDYRPHRTRGLLRQLAMLARGRMNAGVVKLAAAVAAAALVASVDGAEAEGLLRLALGIPVVAGSANVWNLFDVVPGRALKYFVPAAIPLALLLAVSDFPDEAQILGAATGGAVTVFALDLGERGMLGDSGSNLLGFLVGVALFRLLAAPWLAVALGLIVVLHVLAETVTLSRLIQLVPPLRWWDELGARPSHRAPGTS